MGTDRLEKLKSELIAIEVWNSAYYRSQEHDDIDQVSYLHRLKRREELLTEIMRIADADPRSFDSVFFNLLTK